MSYGHCRVCRVCQKGPLDAAGARQRICFARTREGVQRLGFAFWLCSALCFPLTARSPALLSPFHRFSCPRRTFALTSTLRWSSEHISVVLLPLLLQDILPGVALPGRSHRAPFPTACPRAWVSSREALSEHLSVRILPWMLTADAVSFLPFPWSPREGEWGREKAFQSPHLALMNISCFWLFFPLKSKTFSYLMPWEPVWLLNVASSVLSLPAFPPDCPAPLPFSSQGTSPFFKGCFRKGHCPFHIPSLL